MTQAVILDPKAIDAKTFVGKPVTDPTGEKIGRVVDAVAALEAAVEDAPKENVEKRGPVLKPQRRRPKSRRDKARVRRARRGGR